MQGDFRVGRGGGDDTTVIIRQGDHQQAAGDGYCKIQCCFIHFIPCTPSGLSAGPGEARSRPGAVQGRWEGTIRNGGDSQERLNFASCKSPLEAECAALPGCVPVEMRRQGKEDECERSHVRERDRARTRKAKLPAAGLVWSGWCARSEEPGQSLASFYRRFAPYDPYWGVARPKFLPLSCCSRVGIFVLSSSPMWRLR